jgi:hypothetical protein
LILALVVAVACVVAYVAYPLWTLHRIERAVHKADADTLESLIEWPIFRANLKADVRFAMLDQVKKEQSAGAILGGALALTLIDSTLDTMISPAGLRRLFAIRKVEDQARRDPRFSGMRFRTATSISFQIVSAQQPDVVIIGVLELLGLPWKLTRLSVPFDAMEKAMREQTPGLDVLRAHPRSLDS